MTTDFKNKLLSRECMRPARRGLVWRTLAQHPEGMLPKEIAEVTGISLSTLHVDLHAMGGVRMEREDDNWRTRWFAEGMTKLHSKALGFRLREHHGTLSRSSEGCHCHACRKARKSYDDEWEELDRRRRKRE